MHIGQFSLVICSFALAVTSYFIWPYEPSLFASLTALPAALMFFVTALFFKHGQPKKYLTHAALIMMVAFLGFSWAQLRGHMQARNGTAMVGELQVSGVVAWHEAQARGSRWDVRVRNESGGNFLLRLYGKRDHLAVAQPGCHIQITAELAPLSGPIVLGGYDPRRDAWFAGQRGQGFIRSIDEVDCAVPIAW